jgi:hypothetical protein
MTKRVYAVSHVTGYTSEAQIDLFYTLEDAIKHFEEIIKSTLHFYINHQGWNLEILNLEQSKLEDDFGISIDGEYDITWDSIEVYERVFIQELKIN